MLNKSNEKRRSHLIPKQEKIIQFFTIKCNVNCRVFEMLFTKLRKLCSKRLRPSEIMCKRSLPHKWKSDYLFPSLSHGKTSQGETYTVSLSSSLSGKLSTHNSLTMLIQPWYFLSGNSYQNSLVIQIRQKLSALNW